MSALAQQQLRLSDVISALSYALDITEGQPAGHALRSCLIGMRIADGLELDDEMRSSLFYALLLKDAGCSSNAAKICKLFRGDDLRLKEGVKTVDWTSFSENLIWAVRNVAPDGSPLARAAALIRLGLERTTAREIFETRCERGADIARELGFSEPTAAAIRTLDEHWDGRGQPQGIRADEIPLLGRVLCLAQTTEVFAATHGRAGAYEMVRKRRGTWFDPELVRALEAFEDDLGFWESLSADDVARLVSELEPPDRIQHVDDEALDRIAGAFARVIDAKSPFTARHSERVAEIAVAVGALLGLTPEELRRLRHAGLLHDIGKLGVSNMILDKPGRLDDEERAVIKRHPVFTREFLGRVTPFRELGDDAAAHHEKLDGSGYPLGLRGDELSLTARILAVADVFEAMTATRPYRGPLPAEVALAELESAAGAKFDGRCVGAMRELVDAGFA
ncbi:MAG: HD domain-containing protein [Actinomycetota bacterium]|nr:HD domain-containing protein [Actinomycetota bacterium]